MAKAACGNRKTVRKHWIQQVRNQWQGKKKAVRHFWAHALHAGRARTHIWNGNAEGNRVQKGKRTTDLALFVAFFVFLWLSSSLLFFSSFFWFAPCWELAWLQPSAVCGHFFPASRIPHSPCWMRFVSHPSRFGRNEMSVGGFLGWLWISRSYAQRWQCQETYACHTCASASALAGKK